MKIGPEVVRLDTKDSRTGWLRKDGWQVNYQRIECIWRAEGRKVPPKQPERSRLGRNDGACLRWQAEKIRDTCGVPAW